MGIKFPKTSQDVINIVNHGGQTNKTYFIKQCWVMFYADLLFDWPRLQRQHVLSNFLRDFFNERIYSTAAKFIQHGIDLVLLH